MITVEGEAAPEIGWIFDCQRIPESTAPLVDLRGHGCLNCIEGLKIRASWMILSWGWGKIESALPGLFEVEVQQTTTSRCAFRGEF